MEQVRALVTAQPDLTLAELRQALGVECSLTAVWRALRRLNLTRKKVLYAQEQTRPDVDRRPAALAEAPADLSPLPLGVSG